MIKQPQLRAARRHARRLGEQIGQALDGNAPYVTGDVVELLLSAWAEFIDQFGSDVDGDTVARDHVAESFRLGISTVNSRLPAALGFAHI